MHNAALTVAARAKTFWKIHHPFACPRTVEKYFVLSAVKNFLHVTTHACLQAVWIFGNCARATEGAFNGALLM
jgi:hypothetical protein